jgi:outer membrane protein assembly factor BamB
MQDQRQRAAGLWCLAAGRRRVLSFAVACILACEARSVDETGAAKEIIGPQPAAGGLVIHLGSGSEAMPGLSAALAANSHYLVHGIALTDAALERARRAVQEKHVAGRALIEKIEVGTLPYMPDSACLVVVDSPASLAAAGVTREEMLRVTAPQGTLCVFEGGKWARTTKPRPREMDVWTHTAHGADGNRVSADTIFRTPVGYRWSDGLPQNINSYANCRGFVADERRLYTLGASELDNLKPEFSRTWVTGAALPIFLAARDAFTGLPLWKIPCEYTDRGGGLDCRNAAPLATDGKRVFCPRGSQAMAAEAETGRILADYVTECPAVRLLVVGDTLVVAGWRVAPRSASVFEVFSPKTNGGVLEAFDVESAKKRWRVPCAAEKIVAAGGTVYACARTDATQTNRSVLALDLDTGQERWRWPGSQGTPGDWMINACGADFVVVHETKSLELKVLASSTGLPFWGLAHGAPITPILEGQVWCNGRFDARTGQQVKGQGVSGGGKCIPSVLIGQYMWSGGKELIGRNFGPAAGAEGKRQQQDYTGARAACLQGVVAANGMLYAAQNGCVCFPAQIPGFLAIGPSGEWPVAAAFEKPRPVERGPAWGAQAGDPLDADAWPTFRANAERSASTPGALPPRVKELWHAELASPGEGLLGYAWRARLQSCLSAPVVGHGLVLACGTDAGQVHALDAASGKPVWMAQLGGRLDAPPTLWKGLCLVSCHDGWLYALAAADGRMVWRTRAAPAERRMVAFGSVESLWPVMGSPLVRDGVVYVSAGRSSASDGGTAMLAADPATGATVWAKQIFMAERANARQNDLLQEVDGGIAWHRLRVEFKDGTMKQGVYPESIGGKINRWAVGALRAYTGGFSVGSFGGQFLAWDDRLAVSSWAAILRARIQAEGKENKEFAWRQPYRPERQIEALALASNAVITAGRVVDAKANAYAGFMTLSSRDDGKPVAALSFDAPVTADGLAISGGRLYVSLQDGSLHCFGAEGGPPSIAPARGP